jgi:hypothetical protein
MGHGDSHEHKAFQPALWRSNSQSFGQLIRDSQRPQGENCEHRYDYKSENRETATRVALPFAAM